MYQWYATMDGCKRPCTPKKAPLDGGLQDKAFETRSNRDFKGH
jgi:hypothetical protein